MKILTTKTESQDSNFNKFSSEFQGLAKALREVEVFVRMPDAYGDVESLREVDRSIEHIASKIRLTVSQETALREVSDAVKDLIEDCI